MKHIIDTDELALQLARKIMQEVNAHTIPVDVERMPQLQAKIQVLISETIANSPQADGINLNPVSYANPMDILSYRNNYSVTEEKTKTNTVPLYTQDQVDVMLSAYKPQDDVRKDAELDWIENDGNHANSKKVANRMGRIDVKFRSGFVAKDYSPNDFDFSQNGSFYDITAFRPHKF